MYLKKAVGFHGDTMSLTLCPVPLAGHILGSNRQWILFDYPYKNLFSKGYTSVR